MFSDLSVFQPFLQLLLAALLGALIGLERKIRRKEAGLRTFALVALGACFFALLSSQTVQPLQALIPQSSVVQAVAIGIGFLGSGLILRKESQIEGLTTAAALWTTAALGIGVGLGLYNLAVFSTFLALLILSGLGFLEERLFSRFTRSDYEKR